MSPVVALLLGASFALEATSIRTAPVPVFSHEQWLGAADDLKGLMNGTLFLCTTKTKNKAKQNAGGVPLPGDGQPLPEGEFDFQVEDFNPDALKRTPCGIDTPKPERVGKGTVPTPQAKLVTALKLWIDMVTENRKVEYQAACEKMDPFPAGGTADQKISRTEFVAWTNSQPFDGRVETENGEIVDAIWTVLKVRGEDHMTVDTCKADLEKLIEKLTTPPAL